MIENKKLKVVWFSTVPLLDISKNKSKRVNWIGSLCELVKNDIHLTIIYHDSVKTIVEDSIDDVNYISIPRTNKFKKWFNNISLQETTYNFNDYLMIINKIEPDLIQVFGSENHFGGIIKYIKAPVVIHIQGVLFDYISKLKNSYTFRDILKGTNLLKVLKGTSILNKYLIYPKFVKREVEIFKNCKNFMGRTHWDESLTKKLSPNANYFICQEAIRNDFFKNSWNFRNNQKVKISFVSILGDNLFKGIDFLIDVANFIQNKEKIEFRWNVIGVSEKSEAVKISKKKINKKISQSINFLGSLDSEDMIETLLDSDIYLHTALIENSPNSICEAMILGMPIISTNVGGISSLIKHNYDGFLINNFSVENFVNSIKEIINNDDKREYISMNARKTGIMRHNKNDIKNQLLNIYKDIVNESKIKV